MDGGITLTDIIDYLYKQIKSSSEAEEQKLVLMISKLESVQKEDKKYRMFAELKRRTINQMLA